MYRNVFLIGLLCLSISFLALGRQWDQDPEPKLKPLKVGNYIVVAAFKSNQVSFASRYRDEIQALNGSADFGYDSTRKLFYVYLTRVDNFEESIRQMLRTRENSTFSNAWVRVIRIGSGEQVVAVEQEKKEKIVGKQAHSTASVEVTHATTNAAEQTSSTSAVSDVSAKEMEKVISVETEVIHNPLPAPVFRPQTLQSTPVFLSLYNPQNGKLIDGEVEVVDADVNRLITKVKGNTYLRLPDPKNKSGKLTLIASPFGYRKVQNIINFRDTEADTLLPYVDLVGNYYMIKFDMVRYHPGDIVTLYNVYFFNDAAVMLPESKYELNNLLQMMEENPGYRIKLHGHTNGKGRGKIIAMGPSKEFFKITADAIESIGTAKELSGARAGVIKDWLVANGINESRIEVRAWGGDRMIHDKNSAHARRNVRVEVEVLSQ